MASADRQMIGDATLVHRRISHSLSNQLQEFTMPGFVPVRGLHHFAYRCRDAEETRQFYEGILGLPLVHVVRAEEVPSTGEYCPYMHLFFEMKDGSCVAFFDLDDDTVPLPSPNTPIWAQHLALRVDSVTAVEEAKRKLEQAGVKVLGPVDHDGFVCSIYFFDPNGVRLELTTDTADSAEMARYRREARPGCDAWTLEKSLRRATGQGSVLR
ncbi:VOC family protein [Verminephrobacter eiseniae]|nr:VOC family protein [Verminephrobacter eiseniae]